MNLREETRVAEQAKPAIKAEEHVKQAEQLAGTQHKLGERTENVVDRIRALENGEEEFAKEIGLLRQVVEVMLDAKTILVSSQNWSRAAVLENREAGLLFKHKGTAKYFTKIFETDWKAARKALPASVSGGAITTESLRSGGFIEVAAADYQQL